MAPNVPLILHAVLEDYRLWWGGDHGVPHWARVLENGLCLAGETGANVEIVQVPGTRTSGRIPTSRSRPAEL
jgi:uncharacterized protein